MTIKDLKELRLKARERILKMLDLLNKKSK